MSPLDEHLKATLTHRAEDVDAAGNGFASVERQARSLHRRRVAWATGATAVVIAGGVVGGLALTASSNDSLRVQPGDDGNGTLPPTSTTTPSPSPVTTATATGQWLSWPYRTGDGADALAPSRELHPLWAGQVDDDGTSIVIGQQANDDGTMHSRAWVFPPGGDPTAYQLDGVTINDADTHEVSFLFGDGPCLVVVGEPGTGQVEVSVDRTTYEPLETVDGVAATCRMGPPDAPSPRWIRVLDGDGDLDQPIYEGPIDGASNGPAKQPSM
jgi:hypothetical protein